MDTIDIELELYYEYNTFFDVTIVEGKKEITPLNVAEFCKNAGIKNTDKEYSELIKEVEQRYENR